MRPCLFLTCLSVLLPLTSFGQTVREPIVSASNAYFEVVGFDQRSVRYVDELSQSVVKYCSTYVNRSRLTFPQRILVSLRPNDYVDFEGDYRVLVAEQGFVTLDVRWEESLALEQMCLALTEAYLTRYAIYEYGPLAATVVPAWIVQALGVDCHLKFRSAQFLSIERALRRQAPVPLQELLKTSISLPQSAAMKADSYCLFLVLRSSQLIGRTNLARLMESGLRGTDLFPAINTYLAPLFAAQQEMTPDNWWTRQRDAIVTTNFEPFGTMLLSEAWIDSLIDFEAYRDQGGELQSIRGLWLSRQDEALRVMLQARRDLIILRLDQVNPVYFNAARSLGVLYETALDDDAAHVYLQALIQFLDDFENAKELRKVTLKLLQE